MERQDGKHVCGNGEQHDGGAWDGGVAKGGGGALERNGEGVRVGASWGAGICIGRRDLRWAELVDEEVF